MSDNPRQKIAALIADILEEPAAATGDVSRAEVASWDSLNHLRIVMAVEEMFSVRIGAEAVGSLDSVAAIVRLVEAHR